MKTPTEKAIDYCIEVEGQIHQPYIDAFLSGYKAANEWISVDDELPENDTQIVMKNTEWHETMFYTSDDEETLKTEYLFWKAIE